MRKFQRLLTAVLAAALTAALALPAGAAGSSFVDIRDGDTAVNADILRLMGVVDGTGGSLFQPDNTLSRAQFATMVVNFKQQGDQVAIHNTRTIFTDVPGNHWARGYVNLVASLTVKDGERETPLFSGVGDGRFLPDSQITLAQASTVLLRVLGYTSAQTGAVWPQGYMDLAGSIGLTDGLPGDYNAPLTRGQAARLFVNALNCKTADGKAYYTTLGDAKDGTVLLAVNVAADTGEAQGAVRTSSGTYLPKKEGVAPTALQGQRGSLVLNDKQEIVTFVPDDSQAMVVTLSGNAQPNHIKGTDGRQYTVSSDTPVYTAGSEDGKTYLESYEGLYSGSQVTMFTQRGKVVAIYTSAAATSIDADAVVVRGHATTATFHQLTGGATNFNIVKNRQPISLSDIKPYDVVTYDALSNTLIVSDLRITCFYQNASPNVKSPKTITALDNEFQVLESAWDTTKDFNLGQSVSLLLTADGKVAGMAAPGKDTRSTAVGLVTGGSLEIYMPNGGTLALKGTLSNASSVEGQLVIASLSKDRITTSRLTESKTSAPFDVERMTLGDRTVLNSVRIFEKVTTSALAPIDRSQLTMGQIPADKISGYHANSSGMVDYLILNDVTGNAYEYGMMVADIHRTPIMDEDGESTGEHSERVTWKLQRGVGEDIEFSANAGYNGRSGDIVGVVTYKNRDGKNMIRTVLQLDKIQKVSGSAFFESQGALYVTAQGRTYRLADDVECWAQKSGDRFGAGNWFAGDTASDRLNAIKAYSSSLTLYIDPVGQQVRVITAG